MEIALFSHSRQRDGGSTQEVWQGIETQVLCPMPQSSPAFVAHWFLLYVTHLLKSEGSLGTQIKNSLQGKINYSPNHCTWGFVVSLLVLLLLFFKDGWMPEVERCCSISISFT